MGLLSDIWSYFYSGKPESLSQDERDLAEPIRAFIAFLSRKVPDTPKTQTLLLNLRKFRSLSVEQQLEQLPSVYLLVEQYIIEFETDLFTSKSTLRRTIRSKFPSLVKHESFSIIFKPEEEQEILLCKKYLTAVLENLSNTLGKSDHKELIKIRNFIERVPGVEPSEHPIEEIRIQTEETTDWTEIFISTGLYIYDWAVKTLGERAVLSRFENCYNQVAMQYINLDSFQAILALLPDKTLDEEKIGVLNRKQIEKILLKKTARLEELNKQLLSKNHTLEEVQQELMNAKEKSDRLLYNILPKEVADELKEVGTTTPRRFEEVTILFTDFKGFTPTASSMSADHLVKELNDIFHHFDEIMESFNLEKIKSIGDAYMAAGGIPVERENHAISTVNAALNMLKYLDERNKRQSIKWNMRVGIHSGSVIAGVVGQKKFTYDLWGDTVNLASRMETASNPGRVNISAYTHDLVKDHFNCEYRGKINVPGKGAIDMYYVNGSK